MNKLYSVAYDNEIYPHQPDIIQVSAKMGDGKNVSAIASFDNGKYIGLSFPYEDVKYKNEFVRKVMDSYNRVVTKGKSSKQKFRK